MRIARLILPALTLAAFAAPAFAQPPRTNVIWARSTAGQVLTLDGNLNEPAWAQAETKVIQYGVNAGIPGSGWKDEGAGQVPSDFTNATLRFLVVGNQLWLGGTFPDVSIGGGPEFNRFDGLLMGLKDHSLPNAHPAPVAEYLYSWWYQAPPGPPTPGASPIFGGRWATPPWGANPRTAEQIAAWDAVTLVNGQSNNDTNGPDVGYTIEMRFDLGVMGYNVTDIDGDVVEWNVSIYDCDREWDGIAGNSSATRVWWAGPWGNLAELDEVRIYARPDVTINSGPVPSIGPEMSIPNGTGFGGLTYDGKLLEPIWAQADHFDIKFNNNPLRLTYPQPIGPWRAGQYQTVVNGTQDDPVVDPGDATVYYFFADDMLHLGFDVRDQVVQSVSAVDRWDGFMVNINDRQELSPDNALFGRRLSFRVGDTGNVVAEDYLLYLRDNLNGAQVALALKSGTTVDTTGLTPDQGYTAELSLDLTKLGYPHGLGDHILFWGVDLSDGDSFTPFTDSYGTRTWWFREYQGTCCPVVAYMDPNDRILVDAETPAARPVTLIGNQPNPFRSSTVLRFSLSAPRQVTIQMYDVGGKLVATRDLGTHEAGPRAVEFAPALERAGVYLYRLRLTDPVSGRVDESPLGKMVLVP